MSWFYQSHLRNHINKNIYKKPTFSVDFLWKTYQWVVKQQRRLWKTFRWYMIHGVTIENYTAYSADLHIFLKQLKRDHSLSWWDILFQIGCVDIIDETATQVIKTQEHKEKIIQQRTLIESDLHQRYDLRPSWREHMPNATIVLDTTTQPTKRILSESGKRYVNKWAKAWLHFVELTTKQDWINYRETRYTLSYDKWFSIMPQETFLELMHFLKHEKKWTLFAALNDKKEIVSWAVYLFYGKQMIYLYGATDRSYGAIGAQYRLTFEILKRAHEHNRTSLDLLWVAPVWQEHDHHLSWVTRFKQAFDWKTISYLWNYDIVFNTLLYKTFKIMKGK